MVIGIEIFDPKNSSVHYMFKKENNIVIFFQKKVGEELLIFKALCILIYVVPYKYQHILITLI